MSHKSHGSSRNYKFGQKNNWRRMLWNEVLRRTDGREKTESILYLAGPQDLDRSIAVSKGVPNSNLIAIDLSMENVLNIRSDKHYAIRADVFGVLRAWPWSTPICAIVLDFCSGLMAGERPAELAQVCMFSPPLKNAVLAVNLMRGRDPGANVLTREAQSLIEWMRCNPQSVAHSIDDKHRGFAFAFCYSVMGCLNQVELERDVTEALHNMECANPKFFSYRSGTLVFDSVVMSPLYGSETFDSGVLARVLQTKYPKDNGVVRKIAATLATRTRQRIEATA